MIKRGVGVAVLLLSPVALSIDGVIVMMMCHHNFAAVGIVALFTMAVLFAANALIDIPVYLPVIFMGGSALAYGLLTHSWLINMTDGVNEVLKTSSNIVLASMFAAPLFVASCYGIHLGIIEDDEA